MVRTYLTCAWYFFEAGYFYLNINFIVATYEAVQILNNKKIIFKCLFKFCSFFFLHLFFLMKTLQVYLKSIFVWCMISVVLVEDTEVCEICI